MNQTYIISEKHNSFVILPPKTGSSSLSWILKYFDFNSYSYNVATSQYILIGTELVHLGHNSHLPPTNKNLTFIYSTRNPYDRMLSYYAMSRVQWDDLPTKKEFEIFLNNFLENEAHSVMYKSARFVEERIPDFYIRLENLYNDLIQIPFINESNLNKCGILGEMCGKKVKASFLIENRESLYTIETKKKVFNHFEKEFELFGYSK